MAKLGGCATPARSKIGTAWADQIGRGGVHRLRVGQGYQPDVMALIALAVGRSVSDSALDPGLRSELVAPCFEGSAPSEAVAKVFGATPIIAVQALHVQRGWPPSQRARRAFRPSLIATLNPQFAAACVERADPVRRSLNRQQGLEAGQARHHVAEARSL